MLELDASQVRTLQRGQHLVFPDDRMQAVFRVEAGWLARYTRLPSGERQITSLYLPGDFCESQWLIAPVSAEWIMALSNVVVGSIRLEKVVGEGAVDPATSRKILADLIAYLARQSALVAAIGRKSGIERISALLRDLCDRSAVAPAPRWSGAMPLTQSDLADIVGLTPIHVNRILKELREHGAIEVGRGAITVLDADKLRAIADQGHVRSLRI